MKNRRSAFTRVLGAFLLAAVTAVAAPGQAQTQKLKGTTLRVAVLADMTNFDPMQFSDVNFPFIKNLYDSLIEYTPDGKAVPSLATEWSIGENNKSVRATLRKGVLFQSGAPLTSADVAATLKKASDPAKGKNVYATMGIVQDWTTPDEQTIVINFKNPVPERQILDLLQFTMPIEAAGIDTVETKPAGTGAYMLAGRTVGQSVTLKANPKYWREGEPVSPEIRFTVFSDAAAASAALESGTADIIYGSDARSAVRLRDAGFTVTRGPGPLVQVFRINATRPPFNNEKFRQAFNYLMDRESILRVGYAGLGEPVALPWAPASPAFDPSYLKEFAYSPEKAKALLAESGLSKQEMNNWKLLVYGTDQPSVLISQIVQSTLADVGIDIKLQVLEGSEYVKAQLAGEYQATFGGVGNVQKFPSRVATNSIYRTKNNPVLKEPHPFPDYVAAIERVNTTFGSEQDVKAAYDNLNRVLVKSAFAIPTNSYDVGLIVSSPKLDGFTLDIDNLFVGRTIGLKK